jgi:hypothetical protein
LLLLLLLLFAPQPWIWRWHAQALIEKNRKALEARKNKLAATKADEVSRPLPPGWRRVESRSRPGEYVYENEFTEERIAWFPEEAAEPPLPEGWRKVESRSYPGEYVFENIHTLDRQAWRPDAPAPKERTSGKGGVETRASVCGAARRGAQILSPLTIFRSFCVGLCSHGTIAGIPHPGAAWPAAARGASGMEKGCRLCRSSLLLFYSLLFFRNRARPFCLGSWTGQHCLQGTRPLCLHGREP